MKIAILGATSEIAKDLIRFLSLSDEHDCVLFARRPESVLDWQIQQDFSNRFPACGFDTFAGVPDFDVIINFVGVGNPALAASAGAALLNTTATFDELALSYIQRHPGCRYIFLSSGAVYGEIFSQPAKSTSQAVYPVNSMPIRNWYAIAKFHAEMRHRALPELSIMDIRVFNYFSRYQDIDSQFLVTDMIRAIKNGHMLKTTRNNIIRDYLSPGDFSRLIGVLMAGPPRNAAVDCFTRAPTDKYSLLKGMHQEFGLRYEFDNALESNSITGLKTHYYSTHHLAGEFGYMPQKTSLESVLEETRALLENDEESCFKGPRSKN